MTERSEQTGSTGLSTADMVSAANREQQDTAPREATMSASAAGEPRANGQSAGAGNGAAMEQVANGHSGNGSTAASGDQTALLPGNQSQDFRSRWEEVQTGFVDEPRQAVEQADHLVAEVMKRMAELFAKEREELEAEWNRGGEADTEALRMALKRYRSFFERLLSA